VTQKKFNDTATSSIICCSGSLVADWLLLEGFNIDWLS
jgi:hypothetical protein